MSEMSIEEFFAEAKRKDMTLNDLLPGLIDRLAEMGDPDALAAKARETERRKNGPRVFFTGGLWWYRNSEGSTYAFASVRGIQQQYEQYEPDPCYWRSLPNIFKGLKL